MNQQDNHALIRKLQSKIKAQQKTIELLMDAAEQRTRSDVSPIDLPVHNLKLERIVQKKTDPLEQKSDQLKQAMPDSQLTHARLLHTQKMESVGQLAAGIAHEINTPIQFVGTNIGFLEEVSFVVLNLLKSLRKIVDTAPEQVAQELLSVLEEADCEYIMEELPSAIKQSKEGISRVSLIVKALKEFSHPSFKEKEKVVVNTIIETTTVISRNAWKYVSELKLNLASDLPPVSCLTNELGQVILNLITNAAHSIEEKIGRNPVGLKGEIRISTQVVNSFVEILIQDTGTGIPAGIQYRIFDPFFTTKEVGKGTGQGLAISYDVIVKKHGGTLTFITEEDKGTTFVIRLPLLS